MDMGTELTIEEMSCDGCERIVTDALEGVSGVESADADQTTGVATVEGDADVESLIEAVEMAGYKAEAA